MTRTNKNKGFSLIEIIIYVALFTIMIGSLIIVAFQLMHSSDKTGSRIVVQEEINFVLKKMDWALTGATNIVVSSPKLTITNPNLSGGSAVIEYDNVNKKIKIGSDYITTVNVHVNSLTFNIISGPPKGVEIILDIDGQTATLKRYIKI